MNETFIPCDRQPLYWILKLSPPIVGKIQFLRFLTFDEVNKYAGKLKVILKKKIKKKDKNDYFVYRRGIAVMEAAPPFEIVRQIKEKTFENSIILKEVFDFLRNQIFHIPDAPESLIIKILEQTEPMCRENLILDYQFKNMDKCPELKQLIENS